MNTFSSISFKGYKSFHNETFALVDNIGNINVIIGKNNSGKSSILDVIECCMSSLSQNRPKISISQLDAHIKVDRSTIDSCFSANTSGGVIQGNHNDYGAQFVDEILRVSVCTNSQVNWSVSENDNDFIVPPVRSKWNKYIENFVRMQPAYVFKRLSAERNILPEKSAAELELSDDGLGATNIINSYINLVSLDEKQIEDKLLQALNRIMHPDAEFQRIQTQIVSGGNRGKDEDTWEVFLQEKNTGRFPLSQSGSGLKTIILVLLNLLVIPKLKSNNIIFAFEELENNLHPALQRRIFDYIYDYALKKDVCIFLTTHSHVAINAFFNKEKAQIYHVTKKDNKSTVQRISSHLDKAGILDDLDIKASDLLQSNGIIWVEGPSDRIYIKRWLEIFGDNKFEEGKHYQFLYYGGKILSHFSSDMTCEEQDKYINILTTNRNAAIVIDSDRKYPNGRLRDTKIRIRNEFAENKMHCWITKGKEIENYLSSNVIYKAFGKATTPCTSYESFSDYVRTNFNITSNSKVELASKMIKHIGNSNVEVLDIKKQMLTLIKSIEKWNQGIISGIIH